VSRHRQESIEIRGAAEHNLQSVNLTIPKHKLVVFCGVSGSDKSSLAFDTLYAEGQRRYVESLSAYARQFLGQMDKPRYETIRGLSPTISIEQRLAGANPRSTVGTVTEIYDYLRVLFARAGILHCYECGELAESSDAARMVEHICTLPEKTRLLVMAPLVRTRKGTFEDEFKQLRKDGFARVRVDGEVQLLEVLEQTPLDKNRRHTIDVVVDRIVLREDIAARLTDSVETALRVGNGRLVIEEIEGKEYFYSETRHCPNCDLSFPEPSPQLFSFNSPIGACPDCNGLGTAYEVDVERIVASPKLSLLQGCVAPWKSVKGDSIHSWTRAMVKGMAKQYGFDPNAPWNTLSSEHQSLILNGTGTETFQLTSPGGRAEFKTSFEGVIAWLSRRFKDSVVDHKAAQFRPYFHSAPCSLCKGKRLRPEAHGVLVNDHSLPDLMDKTIGDLHEHFQSLKLTGNTAQIAGEVLREIGARLGFLMNVGLNYLTLNRRAASLSGGEAQRIRLASQVGSELTGVLYILDEPSIGLHPRDNERLLDMLRHLRDIGNTVIVVEHDADTLRAADHLVDFGPGAGRVGGRIVASGTQQSLMDCAESITGHYLAGTRTIEVPATRRPASSKRLVVRGARQNNLQNIDVSIPLSSFCVVTGVSGAGKSTLINEILVPALSRELHGGSQQPGDHDSIEGIQHVQKIVSIDQKPIGRTPRSNPATYTKVFDKIRETFSKTKQSRMYGFRPGRFSFNVKGGRCEACQGAGVIKIEMHFLPDVYVTCETCNGRRFNEATLRVTYQDKTIYDVLQMSVDEAREFFSAHPKIMRILNTLHDVGLGYVGLGQPATTLSGGEAQRIKLSRELAKPSTGNTLYVLDEPSTGLHFEDTKLLLEVLDRLVVQENTVVVIEHNLDIIKTADHVIDLGPEGGDGGGKVVASGTPEDIMKVATSHTGACLQQVLP